MSQIYWCIRHFDAFWCRAAWFHFAYVYLVIICPGTALLGLAMEWSHWAWGQVQVPPASFCGCPVTAWLNGFLRWRNRSLWLGLQLGPGFYREKISLCTWEDQDKIGTLKIINTHYRYTIMYIYSIQYTSIVFTELCPVHKWHMVSRYTWTATAKLRKMFIVEEQWRT